METCRHPFVLAAWLFSAALALACGDSGSDNQLGTTALGGSAGMGGQTGGAGSVGAGDGVEMAALEACSAYAQATCKKQVGCFPFEASYQTGSLASCVSLKTTKCLNELKLTAVAWTPPGVLECAGLISNASCDDWVDVPNTCLVPGGSLPAGAACVAASECESSTTCVGNSWYTCGKCKPFPVVGSPCGSCGANLTCSNGQCVKRGELGDTCDPLVTRCKNSLACLDGICATPLGKGAACVFPDECAMFQGLICTQGTCQDFKIVPPGQPCSIIAGEPVLCHGHCSLDAEDNGICLKFAQPGEKCVLDAPSSDGPSSNCELQYRCESGICVPGYPACK